MKIRTHRSCLINTLIQKYRITSNSVNPNNYNKKVVHCSTTEIISCGIEQMKKENFKIATEGVVNVL